MDLQANPASASARFPENLCAEDRFKLAVSEMVQLINIRSRPANAHMLMLSPMQQIALLLGLGVELCYAAAVVVSC